MPKLIFANLLNELMIAKPEQLYAKNLFPVTVRKIWIAEEGDIVITPVVINNDFKDYACSLLRRSADKIHTISPPGDNTIYLANRLQNHPELLQEIQSIINDTSQDFEMLNFANDLPTLNLAKKLGISLSHYKHFPDAALIKLIYELNMKSGFRQIVEDLGFATPPGIVCEDKEGLLRAIELMFQSHETIIIKFNRSSNGYGHWIINKNEFQSFHFNARVDQYLTRYQQPKNFVVEAFINIKAVPSVEIIVDEQGPHLLYMCNQRCPQAAYSGMVTPPQGLSPKIIETLMQAGDEFGRYVFDKGFRGIFDIDTCLDENDKLYFTETNFRRTAGTFIDMLAKQLIAHDYYQHHVWIQDAKLSPTVTSFAMARKLLSQSALNYSHESKTGVILYADTFNEDHKCRYVIFAKDYLIAQSIENEFIKLMQLK